MNLTSIHYGEASLLISNNSDFLIGESMAMINKDHI